MAHPLLVVHDQRQACVPYQLKKFLEAINENGKRTPAIIMHLLSVLNAL